MHDSNTRRCAVCGREYQWEPHRYDGEYIPRYQLNACSPCYMGNWDGWNPHFESKLVKHLESKGLPLPERNERGWFPRD